MRNFASVSITRNDMVQIVLNITAFLILIFSGGGHGSFWGFLTFNIIAAIVLIEILLSTDKTALWVWITKTFTYILLVIKFSHNIGEIKPSYIYMIIISATALVISRRLIKKRAVSMWGQNIAYIIGGYMYVMAIIHAPNDFGAAHIWFWLVNCASYALLVREIYVKNKPKVNLIIPIYAIIACLIYVVLMVVL